MARNWNAAMSETIGVSIGALGINGAISVMFIVRLDLAVNSINIIKIGDQTTGAAFVDYWISAGTQNLRIGGATRIASVAGADVVANDGWVLAGFTKATGASTPQFYKCTLDTNLLGSVAANGTATLTAAGTSCEIGHVNNSVVGSQYSTCDMAIGGVWDVVLTDPQIQTLRDFTPATWLTAAATPKALWRFNQEVAAGVTDLTGNGANQSGIAGTRPSLDPAIAEVRNASFSAFPPKIPMGG